jgi:hypothetical protein
MAVVDQSSVKVDQLPKLVEGQMLRRKKIKIPESAFGAKNIGLFPYWYIRIVLVMPIAMVFYC